MKADGEVIAGLPRYMSLKETHELAGISRALLYRLLREGKGPRSFRIGRRRLFSDVAVQEWLERLEKNNA